MCYFHSRTNREPLKSLIYCWVIQTFSALITFTGWFCSVYISRGSQYFCIMKSSIQILQTTTDRYLTRALTRQQHHSQHSRDEHAGETGSPPSSHDFTSSSTCKNRSTQTFKVMLYHFHQFYALKILVHSKCLQLGMTCTLQLHIQKQIVFATELGWRCRLSP